MTSLRLLAEFSARPASAPAGVSNLTDWIATDTPGLSVVARAACQALAQALTLHDRVTGLHHRRVSFAAAAIAGALELPPAEIEIIRVAAALHDIGKLGLPRSILDRTGPLSIVELSQLQTHSERGYELLCGLPIPEPIADIVRQHHERLDGSGYPAGLAGGAILRGARIVAVADVLEAMVCERPYRRTPGPAAALTELQRGSGILYDRDAVLACVALCSGELAAILLPEGDPANDDNRAQDLRPAAAMSRLTSQQQVVLRLLVEGQSTKGIARARRLGVGTVKIHLSRAYATLGVHNRAGAVAAVMLGETRQLAEVTPLPARAIELRLGLAGERTC